VTVADSIQVVYIAGTVNNWSEPGTLMTRVTDTTFTYDFDAADTAGIEFKFLTGPSWKYEQVQAANFRYSTDSITRVDEFKAYYDTTQADSVTIDVLVPVEVNVLNLTGNFNGWDPIANPMTKVDSSANGKEFKLTIFVPDTTTLEFKFVAGPGWSYEQTNSDNYVYMEDGGVVVCDAFKAIYSEGNVGDIVLNIKVPAGTPEVWIIGDFVGWQVENAVQATKVTDTTYTITIHAADISYKVYNHPDWIYEEAKDTAGTSVTDRTASFLDGPTYDVTVAYWKDVFEAPTAVKDVDNLINRVYVSNSSIVVDGVVEKVTVFDIQGRIMQDARIKGTFRSRALNTGVYIIRVDNQVQKVLVR
jgi:hypothetical protein